MFKRNVITIIVMFFIFLIIPMIVFGASFNCKIEANTNKVKAEEILEIKLYLQDYSNIDKGINVYKAKLEYDENIFEKVELKNFESKNLWKEFLYNENTHEFIAINKSGSKQAEEVVSLKLKVKKDIKAGETAIKIKEVVTSEGKEDIITDDVKLNIQLIEEQNNNQDSDQGNNQDNNQDNNQGNNQNNNQNNNSNNNNNNNSNNIIINDNQNSKPNGSNNKDDMATGKLPQTGKGSITSFILIAIEALIIIAVIFKCKEKGIDKNINKNTKLFIMILCFGLISVQLTRNIYATAIKGELNDDEKIDYVDVSLLEEHLIHLKSLPENKLHIADMNNDGKLTVTDLSLLVRKIENNIDYTVNIISNLESYYINKGEEIEFKFIADVSNGAKLKTVIINEIEYDVENKENSNEYIVKIKANDISGIQELKFTKVILDVGKEVKLDYTEKLEVLKEKPYIENYVTEENINDSKLAVKVNLIDNDNAVTNAVVEIYDNADNKIKTENINIGQNTIEFLANEKEKYKLYIHISYNLDTDSLGEHDEDKTGNVVLEKELEAILEYNFSISNIQVYNELGDNTNIFEKNENIIIKFESKNESKFIPNIIKISGKQYDVTEDEGKYIVKIPGISEVGNNELIIEEVILTNGKVILVEDNSINIIINKKAPIVEDFEVLEDIEKNILNLKFNVKDEDNSIKSKKYIILNSNGDTIAEKEFSENEINVEIKLLEKLTKEYVVKVVATYNTSGEDVVDKEIFTKTVQAEARANILSAELSSYVVEKNQNIDIIYNIETNKDEEISKIIINNIEVNVTKKDEKYVATLNTGNNAGIQNIKTTYIICTDNTEINVSYNNKIEVLKDKPYVDEYQATDKYDDSKVNFEFDLIDADVSLESAKAQLIKKENNSIWKETELKTGINNFDFEVEEAAEYEFKIIASYSRYESGENKETDITIFSKPIQMIQEYDLKISNIKTYKETGEISKYFNRDEIIKISFNSTNNTKFYLEKAVINGKEYALQKEDTEYIAVIDSFNTYGMKELNIEKIYMNNSKELDVNENNSIKIEVLKLPPTVENLEYVEQKDGIIKVTFDLIDKENTIKSAKVIVTDENGKEIAKKENLLSGKQDISFNLLETEKYLIDVIANYDLDTNKLSDKDNEYEKSIFTEEITIAQELIEFKDIETVKLYKKENDKVVQVEEVDVTNFNKDNYIAQVIMKDLPALYAEIKSAKNENGKFILTLDYNNVVQYDGGKKENKLEVEFGSIDKNNIAANLSFEEIIKRINEDPTGEFELNNDLDANDLNITTQTLITTEFKGKLNGNGYTIKNLKKPLFGKLNNAEITNIVIDNANISGPNMGILANNASESYINNVHTINSAINAGHTNGTGGIVGKTENKTLIENCSAINIKASGYKRVGGIVGFLTGDSIIRNSYVTGTISGSYDAIGGIIGEDNGNSGIENSYVDIEYNVVNNWSHGGITGYSSNNSITLKNSLSLATGKIGKRVVGTGCSNKSANNYEIAESELDSNANNKSITEISKEDINDKFFKETLEWDNKIWRLENIDKDNLPTLRNSDPNDIENIYKEEQPENKDVYIPDIARLKAMDNYDTNKEIIYHNMYKIMPFYDAKYILYYGNKINNDSILNLQKIKMIIPYDEKNEMIVGLNSDTYQNITKIKIVFENEETKDYSVAFEKELNNIAIYNITELNIKYNYNKYILDKAISTVTTITDKATQLDYATEISLVTPEEESRLYTDYYNESVKNKIEDIILSILENTPEYNLYLDNEILKTKVEQELTENLQLEKIIYTYNYFDKWYHMKMGGIPLTNIIFTDVNSLNSNQTILSLVNSTIAQGENVRKTNNTANFFNNVIKVELDNKDLPQFLEYFMKVLEGNDNGNEWFKNNFKGILNEKPALGKEDNIRYRAWDLIKSRGKVILPILSAPQEDMYIISVPSQVVIGSMNRYNQHLNGDTEGMKKLIENYATMIGNFYGTSASFISGAEERLNKNAHIQYDTRFGFPNIGTQEAGTTQEPVMKWVYEALGSWGANNGSGAYADGTDVYWTAYQALGGDYSFKVFTHETAHNQDGGYFYEGNGRRLGTWAEDHADSNIAQDLGDGSFVFNLRGDMAVTVDDSVNLTLGRITGSDNIYSYYKEMFETYYVLDYLVGQAFLELTPEQQAKVAVQATYDVETDYDKGASKTTYKQISAEEFEKMNLKNMEDLWNNGIALRGTGSIGDGGAYGGDGHYSVYWYQPHNNEGRPDSYSFKRLGFEMLGVGGYSDGYVIYRSRKSDNDLDALRKITGDENITWKEYKLNRYSFVENNLDKIPYFDKQEVINAYKAALEKDAKAGNRSNANSLRRVLYGMIKRATKDFSTGTIYSSGEEINISSAEQFIKMLNEETWGNYILTNDLDFSNINSTEAAYINKIFVGRINGNGHKISGVNKPIFSEMTYSEVQNLTVENPKYEGTTEATIAIKAKNTLLNNVIIEDSNINLPFAKTVQGLLQTLGNTNISIKDNLINTVEDLQNISLDNETRKMKYILNADIDLSSITEGNSIITGAFTGELIGNGYKLYNLNKPLFENLNGKVTNLKIENMSIDSGNSTNLGALAKTSNNAKVENIVIDGVNIKGRENLGAIVGSATNSNFNKISISGITISGPRFYVGGAIGRSNNTILSNTKVSGEIIITSTHNGGVIGAINGGTLENVFSNVVIERPNNTDNRNQNGGLIGSIESGNPIIRNSISVADVAEDVYKVIGGIDGKPAGTVLGKKDYISNVFENSQAKGISNTNEENNISSVESNEFEVKEFYINTLGWDEQIWDFSDMQNGPSIKID